MNDDQTSVVLEAFRRLDVEGVELDKVLGADLGMDSQEIVSLVCELEETTGIFLEASEIKRSMTVSNVIDIVTNKMPKKG
jgi:acyl carrier protein